MIFEYLCNNKSCRDLHEEYFPTFEKTPSSLPCPKCGAEKRRLFSRPFIRSGETPGYEKENKDMMTMGKAIDSLQKWV